MSTGTEHTSAFQVEAALEYLRARGERITQSRRAVLGVLANADAAGEHIGADEIFERASTMAPGLHRATVYRVLNTLTELKIVAHTHVGGSATVFHLGLGAFQSPAGIRDTPHAHLRCTTCGTVVDIPTRVLQPVSEALRRDLDFRLSPEHAALLGTCGECASGVSE